MCACFVFLLFIISPLPVCLNPSRVLDFSLHNHSYGRFFLTTPHPPAQAGWGAHTSVSAFSTPIWHCNRLLCAFPPQDCKLSEGMGRVCLVLCCAFSAWFNRHVWDGDWDTAEAPLLLVLLMPSNNQLEGCWIVTWSALPQVLSPPLPFSYS